MIKLFAITIALGSMVTVVGAQTDSTDAPYGRACKEMS